MFYCYLNLLLQDLKHKETKMITKLNVICYKSNIFNKESFTLVNVIVYLLQINTYAWFMRALGNSSSQNNGATS